MARQFAVFDIDGTIVRTSLLQLTVKELVNRGRLDGAVAGDIDRVIHDARQRIKDDDFGSYMKQAVDMLMKHSGGALKLSEYEESLEAVVHSLISSTYVYTRQLIDTLRSKNFYLIAISGSEQRAVEAVSKVLGFNTCAAGVKYIDNGTHLTGEVTSYGTKKDEILRAILQSQQLSTKGSLAVGDTSSDIALFTMVEQPIAFNPNQTLFAEARKNGWMVVLERKDVVYGLQPENGRYVLKSVNI
jgi:HAD superfamily phosphoserine phosphatase-like hydrolase